MPVVGDVFMPLAMILGLLCFISLMLSDACVAIAGKPARIWIPGKFLVINALTIQIFSYLKVKITSSSEDEYEDFLQFLFVAESGRVVTCVMIGYFLPGMGRAGSATDWRTLLALVLSLITSEYYSLSAWLNNVHASQLDERLYQFQNSINSVFRIVEACNVVVTVSIILLFLFSMSAILAGRTLRGILAERVSVIQRDKTKESEKGSWQKFEGEIVKSWFLARVCDPQFVIARSLLTSAVGLVITICILSLAIRDFHFYVVSLPDFKKTGVHYVAWMLQWVLILIGGTVIFCRWFTAVLYFPRFFVKKMKQARCTREDYWTRSIVELVQIYNLQKWRLQEQSKDVILSGLPLRMATTMRIHYLLYLLWPLQISVVWFSRCCFFISELVFGFVRICLLGIDKVSSQSQEYMEILEKVCIPGENPTNLWIANEKSMSQVKNHFNETKKKGCDCNDLITLIMPHFSLESDDDGRFVNQLERLPLVAEHFPALDGNCMRMTALSLLNVILILLPLHKDGCRLTKAVEAYQQALDLMSYVDNSDSQHPTAMNVLKVIDIEADRVSVAVCNEFQSLLKLHKEKLNSLKRSPNLAAPESALERVFEAINELLRKAEQHLKAQKLPIINKEEQSGGEKQNVSEEYCDSRNWSAIVASYSKYRVCKLILSRDFNNANELMEYLYGSLADVIGYCLLNLPAVLVKTCREWAVNFEEEKIWDAMYIAGKLVGVMQKCNVELEGNLLEPKFRTCTSNEIQTIGGY